MIIESNIKSALQKELIDAKTTWVASAMISNSGWRFLQKNIPYSSTQFYLVGIDLSTDPKVFDSIRENLEINARVYETKYTFHPKVYLIQKKDNSFTAFIGSSNTTNWGLEKNVEMNFQINDQVECKRLLHWFNGLYADGFLITQKFVEDYKSKFVKASIKVKEIEREAVSIKTTLTKNKGQFFSQNHHEIFNEKYHRINSENLQMIRKEVSMKFKELHNVIYPQFSDYGLTDLHCHHNAREIVSRHFFNKFSGNYVSAMWLHYGKSLPQLESYKNTDTSINKPNSFINNIRMQVIIHEDSLGIWLVLGRNNGSKIDRECFRKRMKNTSAQEEFFEAFKNLDDNYWININNRVYNRDIKTVSTLLKEIQKEKIEEYFVIGCDINRNDSRLSNRNLPITVLEGFKKLYPLYDMMKHR
ncbi:NgoFVII family restriction endonuclease [Aquimarina sp. AD1]|uniref:phospholipase D-like domain-containing protein n=1 Tax=Aquimarina sp. (strain AD1) TaxID=1714848 RepID=UPI000E5056A8|nr:phospholipase D-like domain-containing protein [Aquimarina sp. AD1]AXT55386.1 NgoFVII family restriction endonuclease [Aquimarina sp. AD1]RKN28712.1 NgoFVII family restriction endonuclease [Aquimarina sp. AD1]